MHRWIFYSPTLIAIAEGDKPRIHIFSILDILKGGREWTRVSVDDSPYMTATELIYTIFNVRVDIGSSI